METHKRVLLGPGEQAKLEEWVADRNTPQKLVWRSRIVLLSGEGAGTMSFEGVRASIVTSGARASGFPMRPRERESGGVSNAWMQIAEQLDQDLVGTWPESCRSTGKRSDVRVGVAQIQDDAVVG